MKVHLHIYKVVAKTECDFEADTVTAAQVEALDQAKRGQLDFGDSDCGYIASVFSAKGGKSLGIRTRL